MRSWLTSTKVELKAVKPPAALYSNASGTPLFLIHGFPTSSFDWLAVWGPLSETSRVIAFDMLGFGLSDKPQPGHAYSVVEQADIAEAVLRAAGVSGTYDVLAHDLGASVAQELLARQAEEGGRCDPRIRSVALLNGGLIASAHRPTLVQRLLVSPWGVGAAAQALLGALPPAVFRASLNAVFGPAAPLTAAAAAPLHALWAHKRGWAVTQRLLGYMAERKGSGGRWVGGLLAQGGPPIALINGPADPVSGAHLVEAYAAERARRGCDDSGAAGARTWAALDAVLVLDGGVGHWPQLEAPAAVVGAVRALHERVRAATEAGA